VTLPDSKTAAEKAEEAKKTAAEKAEEAKKTAAEKAEADAGRQLRLAKMLEKDGLKDKAMLRYHEIIKQFPETKAAEEARKLLDKLKK
jgi:hypothetical protein